MTDADLLQESQRRIEAGTSFDTLWRSCLRQLPFFSGRVVRPAFGPAMRADIVLDMTAGGQGEAFRVVDDFYPDLAYRLIDLAYGSEPPLRRAALPTPSALPSNTMPEPDLAAAERHEIVFNGGMMSGMGMGGMGGMMGNGMRGMYGGAMWTINGVAAMGHDLAPMLTLERGGPACWRCATRAHGGTRFISTGIRSGSSRETAGPRNSASGATRC